MSDIDITDAHQNNSHTSYLTNVLLDLNQVELSLGMGILVGSCMVAGTLVGGFRTMLDKYLLNALANKDHGYVFLFILFMAGLVGLMEKSGGLKGITHALQGYVKTSRSAQSASFFAGILIFFDDYGKLFQSSRVLLPMFVEIILISRVLSFCFPVKISQYISCRSIHEAPHRRMWCLAREACIHSGCNCSSNRIDCSHQLLGGL